MKLRHEVKHEINYLDKQVLHSRLPLVMKKDPHCIGGVYHIRSLYFDNLYDKALREKIDGVNKREKFRIRMYNMDKSFIVLEKKTKTGNLCGKVSCLIKEYEVKKIIDGDIDFLRTSPEPLMNELYLKMINDGLKPKTIIDYDREPYVYSAGNVRVTMDYNIKTGILCKDFFSPVCPMVTSAPNTIILEVKWDEYLPDIIKEITGLSYRQSGAFSKYAAGRIYG